VQRSQHLTQADPRVFGAAYVAQCSSVDGQAAFLGEDSDNRHIEYFQGLERFHEQGLPNKLPVARRESLRQDPHVRELAQKVQSLKAQQAEQAVVDTARNSLSNYRRSLLEKALRAYQKEWVRTQRELKILNRGKQPAMDMDRTEHQLACLLIPERGRLASLMKSDKPLAPTEMWLAIADLHSLSVVQAFTVLYLPGRRPVQGFCPVAQCRVNLTK
jgi:hypothetical protein